MWTPSRTVLPALLLCAALPHAPAQENHRSLERPGAQTKHLTANQTDHWHFEGKAGERVVACVTSTEFDPVLKLADAKDAVLQEADDPGSESRFAARLPADGRFRIQVHAFEMSGGGNYRLEVRRFATAPLEIGRELTAVLGPDGKAHFDLEASKDQVLVCHTEGAVHDFEILDPKGRPLERWEASALCRADGEHILAIQGEPGARCRTVVRAARRREFADSQDLAGELAPGSMDVWTFRGEPGQFVYVETRIPGALGSRLTLVRPDAQEHGQRLDADRDRPELQLLPVGSKPNRQRHAAVLGRKTEYQLQVIAASVPGTYTLRRSDPVVPLTAGKELAGRLPIGGAAFHEFTADAGRLFSVEMSSSDFDPLLRMTSDRGAELAVNDDAGTDLGSRIAFLAPEHGRYRLQVASLGDGGGGDYRIALAEIAIPRLEAGAWSAGTLGPGARDCFQLSATAGRSVVVLVRSPAFEPLVEILGPAGERLGNAVRYGPAADVVVPLTISREGAHTLMVSSRSGEGGYRVRVIDVE
jgi:hypothetical protein